MSKAIDASEVRYIELDLKQVTGRACIICGEQKAQAKGVPMIHIGSYHWFRICAKGHIKDDVTKLSTCIEIVANHIRVNGDNPSEREILAGNIKEKDRDKSIAAICAGYDSIPPQKEKKKNATSLQMASSGWRKAKGGKRYFSVRVDTRC
jgi:hypothetical protein